MEMEDLSETDGRNDDAGSSREKDSEYVVKWTVQDSVFKNNYMAVTYYHTQTRVQFLLSYQKGMVLY